MVVGKILFLLLHLMSLTIETKSNSESIQMVRLSSNSARDGSASLLEKEKRTFKSLPQASYHFENGNISSNQQTVNENGENIREEVQEDVNNQALLSDDADQLYENHLIEKRDDSYLENTFLASQDRYEASKYGKYGETKLKTPETTEPKQVQQMYNDRKLERIKYSETEIEPHYTGNHLESIEKSRKLSRDGKVHTRSNNALRKHVQNKDYSRNVRSRQSTRGIRKIPKTVKTSKQANKFENDIRPINEPFNNNQHFHESPNNLIPSNGGYFRTHKKRSSTEHSGHEKTVKHRADSDNPDLLLNTNTNEENINNKKGGFSGFIDYGIEKLDGQQGDFSDYEGISEKPLSVEDDINLYLSNFNIFPNNSRRKINDYRSKFILSQLSNNKAHLKPLMHIHPANPTLKFNDNNLFQNFTFSLPRNELITESYKNTNPEESRAEKLAQNVLENFENKTANCNKTVVKDVFDEHTTQTMYVIENNTFMETNTFSEITVTQTTTLSPLPEFSGTTESTTEVTQPITQLIPTANESDSNTEDDTDLKLANEVILKVLKKVKENEKLRQHILPSLEINPEEIQNGKYSHKSTCKLNNKFVINKMSHELESLVEQEVREEDCLVLSPQQKSSLTRLLEYSKKAENKEENNNGELNKLVKADSKDTDTSFAEAMSKKIATLKHLLSQYEKLSEDEKLKVHNVHEYLIEQLNNVYRLINLEETHGHETHLSHDKENKDTNNSPLSEKINTAGFGEPSKQDKSNAINTVFDESHTFEHSHSESSITDPLSNLLHTLKKHISKNEFNKEQQKNNDSGNQQKKVRSTKEINSHANLLVSDNKRSAKSRAKRRSEHQKHNLKPGGISSAYYTLALLAKEN